MSVHPKIYQNLCRDMVLFCTLLCLFPVAAAAQAVAVEATWDFGTVYEGEKVEHIFTLHNQGEKPLHILKVRSSCGCTAATVDRQSIPPGGSAGIRALFNSSRFHGGVSKRIHVQTDAPEGNGIVTFTLKGLVRRELELLPQTLQLPPVSFGAEVQGKVVLKNLADVPLQLQELRSTHKGVTARLPATSVAAGGELVIPVSARATAAGKGVDAYLLLTTDNPRQPQLRVIVRAAAAD